AHRPRQFRRSGPADGGSDDGGAHPACRAAPARGLRPFGLLRGRRPLQRRLCSLRAWGLCRGARRMTQPLVTSDAMLTGRFAWFDVVARQLDRLLAVAGVAILLVETTLLFVGVIARYVIHKPLVWSDEVNSILF